MRKRIIIALFLVPLIVTTILVLLVLGLDYGVQVGVATGGPGDRTIPLDCYVDHDLIDAAEKVETGQTQQALDILAVSNARTARVDREMSYLRAICLQSQGKFDEAARNYRAVKNNSADKDLCIRAAIGEQCCSMHVSFLPGMMTHFPGSEDSFLTR